MSLPLSATVPATHSVFPGMLLPGTSCLQAGGGNMPALLSPRAPNALAGSSTSRPNLFSVRGGTVFSRCSASMDDLARRAITILVGVAGAPFELKIAGCTSTEHAVLLAPLTRHSVVASAGGVVGLMLFPDQEAYRRLRAVKQDLPLRLERGTFHGCEAQIAAAAAADFGKRQAQMLFDDMMACVLAPVPPAPPLDMRVAAIMHLVAGDPCASLTQLAGAVGLSYHRLSHLFTQNIGLPLRSYQVWQKGFHAAQMLEAGHTLAEAAARSGFTDVEHLCRFYRKAYGDPASCIYGKVSRSFS